MAILTLFQMPRRGAWSSLLTVCSAELYHCCAIITSQLLKVYKKDTYNHIQPNGYISH